MSASVYSEKTCLKKLMLTMNKSKETTVFGGCPEIDFRYETKARKVMVDFKFDALYRIVFIEPTLHRECYPALSDLSCHLQLYQILETTQSIIMKKSVM